MNSARIEVETPLAAISTPVSQGLLPVIPDVELETPQTLPRDHPSWMRDALAVSARARALIASLRPVIVRVLTFWDHHVRSITIGARSLEVDASGSYRLD